jgi:hypothetical protein
VSGAPICVGDRIVIVTKSKRDERGRAVSWESRATHNGDDERVIYGSRAHVVDKSFALARKSVEAGASVLLEIEDD